MTTTTEQLFAPLRDAALSAARMMKHVGGRLDNMSLDLARDVGAVVRDVQALASDVQAGAAAAHEQATTYVRATPRAARLAQAGAMLLARYQWLRMMTAARGEVALRDDDVRDLARRTTAVAADLRGGIAKLGQIASCRPDLVGAIWASELAALQDDVPAVDTLAIRATIEAELGRSIAELFADFDEQALAAASLAQVHAATMHDGTRVVVKVQVPGITDVIAADIAAMRAIVSAVGEVPGADLTTLVGELARALNAELDYLAEAESLRQFAGGKAIVPRPIPELSTAHVLTMTRIDGERLLVHLDRLTAEGHIAMRDQLLASLVDDVAAQVFVRGLIHADPHPGNFLVTSDGALAMLDFGCTLELTRPERTAYARLMLAIASGQRAAITTELDSLGFRAGDPAQLAELASSLVAAMRPGTSVVDIDWQAAFAEQLAQARAVGTITIPRSFAMLGRVLATIAGLLVRYRPAIQLHSLIGAHLSAAMT